MLKGEIQSLERLKKQTVETVTVFAAGLDVHLSPSFCVRVKNLAWNMRFDRTEIHWWLQHCLSNRALPAADMQPESDFYMKNSWNPADAENISCQKIPKYDSSVFTKWLSRLLFVACTPLNPCNTSQLEALWGRVREREFVLTFALYIESWVKPEWERQNLTHENLKQAQ